MVFLGLEDGVLGVALALYYAREDSPTVEWAILRMDSAPGKSDGRIRDDYFTDEVRVRRFFPTSGCRLYIENDILVCAEPGLQGFINHRVALINDEGDILIIIFETAPIASPQINGYFDMLRILRSEYLSGH